MAKSNPETNGFPLQKGKGLGVDLFFILLSHPSFREPAVLPGLPEVFYKEGSLQRMGKVQYRKGGLKKSVPQKEITNLGIMPRGLVMLKQPVDLHTETQKPTSRNGSGRQMKFAKLPFLKSSEQKPP